MPGYDEDRFIDLPNGVADNFECSVCLNILNDAVISGCGHSFCKDCVKELITKHNQHNCPQCRDQFTRKRGRGGKKSIIISGYMFKPNFNVNAFISQLTVKCDFKSNGCKERVVLESLSAHLLVCEHRFCTTCNLVVGKPEDHDCVELLIANNEDLKNKFDNSNKELDKLKIESINLARAVAKLSSEKSQIIKQYKELLERNSRSVDEMTTWKLEQAELAGEDWQLTSSKSTEDVSKAKRVYEMVFEKKKLK